MKKEHDKELVELCPNLYKDRDKSMQETALCWGFQCGDGWYQIVKDLSIQLEELILQIPEEARHNYRTSTVKEKLGTLRFYMWSSTDQMEELIDAAEERSALTCEECGASAEMRGEFWYYVACDEHTKPKDKVTI